MPKGLIRYTTENALQGKPTHIIRPRTVIYFCILMLLVSAFAFALFNRSAIDMNVIHDRNSFYRVVNASTIENVYTLKVMNKGTTTATYEVSASGLDGLEVLFGMNETELVAEPGQLVEVPIKIRAAKGVANKKIHTIEVTVSNAGESGESTSETVKYFGYDK